jgi:integrase
MAPGKDRYLKRHRGRYYLSVRVPTSLVEQVGKAVHVEPLHTGDVREARVHRDIALGRLREHWRQLREVPTDPRSPAWLAAHLTLLREQLRRGEITEDQADVLGDVLLEQHLATKPEHSDEDLSSIRASFAALADATAVTLGEAIKTYLTESAAYTQPQTQHDKKRTLGHLTEHFGANVMIRNITVPIAGKFVTDVVAKLPIATSTKRLRIATYSSLFNWAATRGMVDFNPFARQASTLKEPRRGGPPKHRPWTNAELTTFFSKCDRESDIWSLGALALYTGMRREEVCRLKIDDIHNDAFHIHEGKTAAAVRQVPIHPVIAPLVERLTGASTDGFLMALTEGAYGRRANVIANRFAYKAKALKITGVRLHDLRRTFIQGAEIAGVAVNVIETLVGHTRAGQSMGVYSPGVTLPLLKAAVESIAFGEVDQIICPE